MDRGEAQNRYRATMLLIALGVGAPLIAIDAALGGRWPWKSLWLSSSAVIALWLRFRSRPPSRVMCALGPLSVALGTRTIVELATIGAMPIIVAVLFIERFDAVVVVTVSGLLANLWLFWFAGWPLEDLLSVGARLSAGSLIVGASAWFARRRRRLQRALDQEHQSALLASEVRRAQAERLAMMGRLAAGVAHEVNNPLAVVKANLGALARHVSGRDVLPTHELDEAVHDAQDSVDRIAQIVSDLKTWSRDDGQQLEPTDLGPLVASTVRLAKVRMPREVVIEVTVPPGLPPVPSQPRKLAQVVLNLLLNAGDALEGRAEPRVRVFSRVDDEAIELRVADNGPGLGETVKAHLFEPFFTTKAPGKGTGLGLALSREYMESFGGTLTFEEVPGGGACFCLRLPRQR